MKTMFLVETESVGIIRAHVMTKMAYDEPIGTILTVRIFAIIEYDYRVEPLDKIALDELHDALEAVEGKRPTQRLLAGIAYKNGVTQNELAEWNDTGRRTIYNWLMRLDTDESLTEAVTDDQRSGRNRKLSKNKLDKFRQTVQEPPKEAGYDEPAWTTKLVRHHLKETYDVEYSIPSCRRLLKEAGLSYQQPRPETAEVDLDDREEFDETIKKTPGAGRHRSLYQSDENIGQRRPNPRLVPAKFTTQRSVIRAP